MQKRFLCLWLCALLLLSGCANNGAPTNSETTHSTTIVTDSTATTTITSTIESNATETGTSTTTTSSTTTQTSQQNAPPSPSSTATATTSTATTQTTTTTKSDTIVFKATIRDENNQLIGGVTVTVYTDTESQSAVTNDNGVAKLNLLPSSAYKVVLSDLPAEYTAKSEYLFRSTTVNITLQKRAVQNEADHSLAQYAVGKMMTDFSLADTDGNTYRLSNLLKEKKLIILDFWFVSCEPCKLEFPYFEAAVQKYADDVALLAVNPFDNANAIQQLREQLNRQSNTAITFPMFKDTCNLSLGFDVVSYPTTVFIDSNGYILDIHVGMFPSAEALISKIETYID